MKGFIDFIREQGVVGLAIGFILGDSARAVVNSLVRDVLNPIISIPFKTFTDLSQVHVTVGGSNIFYGALIAAVINFIALAAVVYYVFKGLKLDKLDKPKEKK